MMTARSFAVLVLLATGCSAAAQEEDHGCATGGEQCKADSLLMTRAQRGTLSDGVVEEVEGALWPKAFGDKSKCSHKPLEIVDDQAGCEQLAVSRGHSFYQFRTGRRGLGLCNTFATCDSPITRLRHPWKVYAAPPPPACILVPNAALSGHNTDTLEAQTVAGCKQQCSSTQWCKSFDWHKKTKKCDLSDKWAEDVGGLKTNYRGNPYDHYACKQGTKQYTFVAVGIAGPERWLSSALGQGVDACFQTVMADSQCAKDYFTYVARGDTNCGCKTRGRIGIRNYHKTSDYYKIQPGGPSLLENGVAGPEEYYYDTSDDGTWTPKQ